jgi:hypothetical protein
MSEEMVPKDQPYGERKETVAAMRRAGMPTELPASRQRPQPAAAQASSPLGFDPLTTMTPSRTLADNEPPMVAPDKYSRIREVAESSPNPLLRYAAMRVLEAEE